MKRVRVPLCELKRKKAGGSEPRSAVANRWPHFDGMPADSDPGRLVEDVHVLIAAAGSVGGPAALSIARLNPGSMIIADPKDFKAESLLTHLMARTRDVHRSKALELGAWCLDVSSTTRVFTIAEKFQRLPLVKLREVTHMLGSTDRISADLALAQWAMNLGVPLFLAHVHGASGLVQIAYYANRDPARHACPACNMSARDFESAAHDTRTFSCDGPAAEAEPLDAGPITASIPGLCAQAGTMAANLLVKESLGLGSPLPDACLIEQTFIRPEYHAVVALPRNPDCPLEHRRWERKRLSVQMRDCSLQRLLEEAGLPDATDGVSLEVGEGVRFVERMLCPGCGHDHRHHYVRANPEPYCRCGRRLINHGSSIFTQTPLPVLEPVRCRSFQSLGAGSATWALVRARSQTVWLT